MRVLMLTVIFSSCIHIGYTQKENSKDYSSTLIYSYSANDTLGLNKTLEAEKKWDSSGRLIKIIHYDGDSLKQTVDFKYNNNNDITEKIFTFSDGETKTFTWKYEYTERGLLSQEIAYNTDESILYKINQTFNDLSQLTSQSAFFTQDSTLVLWNDIVHNNGMKIEDVRFVRTGNAYHKLTWKDQEEFIRNKFVIKSFVPNSNEDIFYNYYFKYDKAGKKTQSTFLINNDTIEKNSYSYNENGLLDKIYSFYSDEKNDWDFYYDQNSQLIKITNSGKYQVNNPVYEKIIDNKTDTTYEITTIYVVETIVEKFSNGRLIESDEYNFWDEISVKNLYNLDGTIMKKIIYVLEEADTIFEFLNR